MLDVVIRGLAHVLVPMFAIGLAGSTIVVAITLFHDVIEFFGDEDTI